jgi:hypothetical protein
MRLLLERWNQQKQADHGAAGGTEKVEVKERTVKMINQAADREPFENPPEQPATLMSASKI